MQRSEKREGGGSGGFRVRVPSLFLLGHDLHNVLILTGMGDSNSLGLVLGRTTPYQRVLEVLVHLPMDAVADVLDRATVAHDQRLAEVGTLSTRLRVHADEGEALPDALQKNVQIQPLL